MTPPKTAPIDFTMTVDTDGIATIIWDCPNKSINILNMTSALQLDALIDSVLSDDKIKGAVIASGKSDFAAGMDLNVIKTMAADAGDNPAKGLFDGIMGFHRILRKIERGGMDAKNQGGKPIAAALSGTALGIGLELALACHRIFAADNPKAKIGLPEILIGIFPGAGGTTRITRKMDLMMAAPILLQGQLNPPQKAKTLGLIDEVCTGDVIKSAKDWVKTATDADIVKPWDVKGFKIPGGVPYSAGGFMRYVGAAAMVHGNTMGVYPAAQNMLSAIYEGAGVPFDVAIRIEARWFAHILMNPSSSAMINTLFTSKKALEKGAVRPKDVPPMPTKRLGILGAGMMGAGIAFVSARAGIDVVLIDRDEAGLTRGINAVDKILTDGINRGKITASQKDAILARITPSTDFAALKGCDLIVEAVFEQTDIKAKATQLAQTHLAGDVVFATNTSTLPITQLAKFAQNAANYIGIHFFSPVHKMNLVEIIKGKNTGDIAVAKALDFTAQIKKTPIVVNDARFFYANRCILPYANEGISMIAEGVSPALIENAARLLGMPVGPLQLTDEISIDLSVNIIKATKDALGGDYHASAADDILFKLAKENRLGRKNGAGFYEYDEKGRRAGLWQGLGKEWPVKPDVLDLTTIQHRMAFAQTLEAIRAFEDGVLMDIREGDVAAILGWGFMPWSGGPFSWVDMLGAAQAVEICNDLTARFGERFAPPKGLCDMAKNGGRYYPL